MLFRSTNPVIGPLGIRCHDPQPHQAFLACAISVHGQHHALAGPGFQATMEVVFAGNYRVVHRENQIASAQIGFGSRRSADDRADLYAGLSADVLLTIADRVPVCTASPNPAITR